METCGRRRVRMRLVQALAALDLSRLSTPILITPDRSVENSPPRSLPQDSHPAVSVRVASQKAVGRRRLSRAHGRS